MMPIPNPNFDPEAYLKRAEALKKKSWKHTQKAVDEACSAIQNFKLEKDEDCFSFEGTLWYIEDAISELTRAKRCLSSSFKIEVDLTRANEQR